MILPSSFATPEAQRRILSSKGCTVYIRPESSVAALREIEQREPKIQFIRAPELNELLNENPAHPVEYRKSWEHGKDDPWLVFHTSGTTGSCKISNQQLFISSLYFRSSKADYIYPEDDGNS